ncbi:hypothetical protein [Clostridium drakei]|uniref:hypothetical protein n=1 Tax=Clostridium drakei TaxID=332101 RepID=UPI001377E43E|nr:hypothetical protein [Clostridium drakei]
MLIKITSNTKLHNNVKDISKLINKSFESKVYETGLAVIRTKEFGEIAIFKDEYVII